MGAERTVAVPAEHAPDPELREWLEWAFSVPDGWRVGDVTRYGAADRAPMTVEIVPPGSGKSRVVRFEEERDAAKHGTLRLALTRDAGLRAAPITSAKLAGDAYYVLCSLARIVGGGDPRDEAREWIDGYRQEAVRLRLSVAKGDLHRTLDTLRRYPYSKRKINLWLAAVERDPRTAGEPPRPPLVIDSARGLLDDADDADDDADAGGWTSITHLATYIRWGRDHAGVIDPDALAGRVVELGGKRWKASAWDATTRQRQHRITTVLIWLPGVEDTPDEGEDAPDV